MHNLLPFFKKGMIFFLVCIGGTETERAGEERPVGPRE